MLSSMGSTYGMPELSPLEIFQQNNHNRVLKNRLLKGIVLFAFSIESGTTARQFKVLHQFEAAWKARGRDFKVDVMFLNPKTEFINT